MMVGTPDLEAVRIHPARLVVQRAAESDRQLNGVTSPRLSKHGTFAALAVAFWQLGAVAHAFSDPTLYGTYPEQENGIGAGGGRFFTGSPADGYSCGVCHTSYPAYSFPLAITGLPKNGYIPGEDYVIKIAWPEAAAQAVASKAKGNRPMTSIVAEFLSEGGGSSGTLRFQQDLLFKEEDFCDTAVIGPVVPTEPMAGTVAGAAGAMGAAMPPAAQFELATRMYIVNRGFAVIENRERVPCEVSDDPERRCIMAVKPCGAKQLQMRWTAPSRWKDPIWFSAGFVTTYDATSKPDDNDFVTEVSIPLNAADDGATYQSELEAGCSVRAARGYGRGLSSLAWIGAALWLGVRRRRRAAVSCVAALALCALSAGCKVSPSLGAAESELVGKFEVGPFLYRDAGMLKCERKESKNVMDDPTRPNCDNAAGSGADEEACAAAAAGSGAGGSASNGSPTGTGFGAALEAAGVGGGAGTAGSSGARASAGIGPIPSGGVAAPPVVAGAGTSATPPATMAAAGAGATVLPRGKLDLTFTTSPKTPGLVGFYDKGGPPKSYGAVWITDEQGGYIKTIDRWGAAFRDSNLYEYTNSILFACQVDKDLDAITKATPIGHLPRSASWDGYTWNGKLAKDGKYVLHILSQIDEDAETHVPEYTFSFTKGRMPFTIQAPSVPPQRDLTLTYTPQ